MSDAIRDKLERHDEIINNLQLEQARTSGRIVTIEERLDRNQAVLVEQLARIETKVDSTTAWMNESKGGLKFMKWAAGISVAILGSILAWLKFFKGG